MSFGFGVGDFVGTIELAWNLYTKCYKIAKGAPKDFQCLIQEINMLHSSVKLLRDEANDKNSVLVRAGDDRVEMVKRVIAQVNVTLKELEKHLRKYENLSKIHSSSIRKWWTGVKWSAEAPDLDALRNKLVYHNGVISLLLTSCGNSSLQRIETIASGVEKGVNDIKNMIWSLVDGAPTLSAIQGDTTFTVSLSRDLMKNAENGRRWSAIGVDEWIQAGSWWVLKSQIDLYTGLPLLRKVSSQGYADLIKAAWILIDIITRHPQLDYLETSTGYGVKLLVETIRRELENITTSGLARPTLTELGTCDLSIWETQVKEPTLQPHLETLITGLSRQAWMTENEYIPFQRFAYYQTDNYSVEVPCVALFLMDKKIKEAKIVLRDRSSLTLATFTVSKDETPLVYPDHVGHIMRVGDQKIRFATTQDVHHLCAISEAAQEYLFFCEFNEKDLETLQALTLLFSIKNNYKEVVERLLEDEEVCLEIDKSKGLVGAKYPTRLRWAANDLAHQFIKMHEPMRHCSLDTESCSSLFLWCLKKGYYAIAIILGEGKSVRLTEDSLTTCASLHDAIRSRNIELVKLISFENGFNLEATDSSGCTALETSLQSGFITAVDFLIEAGANPSTNGSRALITAVKSGHLDIVNRLLNAGANPKAYDSALKSAAEHGHLDIVDRLLDAGADPKADDSEALGSAAEHGHLDIVNRLLDAGADPKADDSEALGSAAEYGHLDIVNRLLDAGAGPGGYSSVALARAAGGGHLDIVNRLLDAGADLMGGYSRALILAAEHGHLDIVNRLLDAGADPMGGYSWALISAAEHGHLDIVNRLLDAGADPNGGDSWALSSAAESGRLDIVNRLLDAGADPKGDDSGALSSAAEGGHLDIVNRLLDVGADPKGDDSGALSSAAKGGHLDIVNRLLDVGADPKGNDSGALSSAAESGHLDLVNRLLDAGADPKGNNSGALGRAARYGHLDIVNRLLDAGADPNGDDSVPFMWVGDSNTLMWAAEHGRLDIVNRLLDAGADPKAGGSVALMWAAKRGHLDIVNRLRDAGANIERLDSATRAKLEAWKRKNQSTITSSHIPPKTITPTY